MAAAGAQAERRDERPEIRGTGEAADFRELFEGGVFEDLFGSAQSGPVLANYEPSGFDYSRIDAERGRSIGIFRSTAFGLVSEPAINAYVNRVLQRILEYSPERPIPARAYVVADGSFGAAAAPDGAIFVNLGLIRDMESEDELGFILAHELAHIIRRHHGSDWYVSAQRRALAGAALAGDMAVELGQMVNQSLPGMENLQTAILIGRILYEVSDVLVAPLFTREEEEEADILGLDLMIAAGYNMAAATTLLEKLAAWEDQHAPPQAIKTEAEREREMSEAFLSQGLTGAMVVALSAFGDLFKAAKKELKKEHYPAAERIATVQNYMLRFYLKDVPPPTTDLWWAKADPAAKGTLELFDNYDAAKAAYAALNDGDLKLAETKARIAVSGTTKHDAYPRLAFYSVRKRQGRKPLAMKNLELAQRGSEPSLMLYRALLDEATAAKDWAGAVLLIEEARLNLADSPFLLPYQIQIYRQTGRQKETPSLLLKCTMEYPELVDRCKAAAGQR